jgi:hypothetical protein
MNMKKEENKILKDAIQKAEKMTKEDIIGMLKQAIDDGTVEHSDDDGVFRGNLPGKIPRAFQK